MSDTFLFEELEREKMEQEQTTPSTRRPEAKFKAGGVEAAVWRNDNFGTLTVVVTRTYRKKDDSYASTSSMQLNDVPKAKLVLDEAYAWMIRNQNQ